MLEIATGIAFAASLVMGGIVITEQARTPISAALAIIGLLFCMIAFACALAAH